MAHTAFIFPGQGSQKVGMAKTFALHPVTKNLFEEADDVLKFNLTKLMLEGDEAELGRTVNTQPALLLAGVAALRFYEDFKEEYTHALAHYVAGHSLGEYTALVAAGVLTFAEALCLVRLRGQAMQEAVPEGMGKMAAILGLDFNTVQNIAQEEGVYIANDNAVGQVVLSGEASAIEGACTTAKKAGAKRAVILPVSAPFHSPLVAPAAEVMKKAFVTTSFATPKIPVVSNVKACAVTQAAHWPELLVKQIVGAVRWRESMVYLADQGVETLVEFGSGKVLTGLAKRCDKRLKASVIETTDIALSA